jgi:hypothetical protein
MPPRHPDTTGQIERKLYDTKIETNRDTNPNFAKGIIRSDATLGTLKRKLRLPADASENRVKKELKKLD